MDTQARSSLLDHAPGSPESRRPRPQPTWPAVVALYLFAPLVAELLSGSTPPLAWNNILGAILTLGLYGSGAVLAREIVRARGLSWGNLAVLGIAYGVLEEGITYQSWFNPRWTPPPDAARALSVNWTFVAAFTSIHMVLSIMTPIVLVEAIFPSLASRPWLGRVGRIAFTAWLALIVLVFGFSYGFRIFSGKGYDHPPLSYVIAPVLFVVCLLVGTLVRIPAVRTEGTQRPPRFWSLRFAGFLGGCVVLSNLFFWRNILPVPIIPIALIIATDVLGVYVVRRWARRPGWGMQHQLALVSGIMGVFIVFAPIVEFVLANQHLRGLTLVNLLALAGLTLLRYRLARNETTGSVPIARSISDSPG